MLKEFGERPEVDRQRLNAEYNLVATLDPTRPIIMSTSTSWGIPARRPLPNVVGFSMYNIVFNKGAYRLSLYYPIAFRVRALLIKIIWAKPSFIHELQAEPWGPKAIWEMSSNEQDKSMNAAQLQNNIILAKKTRLSHVDLWGG